MFYDVFTELCKSINKSRSTVVEEIGLQRSVVSKWKSGGTPSGKSLERLAIYFDVSKDYLIDNGNKYDPLSKKNRIFKVMNDRRMSLEQLSLQSKQDANKIVLFALLERTSNMNKLLEDVAAVLKVSEGYLIGMTNSPIDYTPYYLISEKIRDLSGYDPYVAADMQKFQNYVDTHDDEQMSTKEVLLDTEYIFLLSQIKKFQKNGRQRLLTLFNLSCQNQANKANIEHKISHYTNFKDSGLF